MLINQSQTHDKGRHFADAVQAAHGQGPPPRHLVVTCAPGREQAAQLWAEERSPGRPVRVAVNEDCPPQIMYIGAESVEVKYVGLGGEQSS